MEQKRDQTRKENAAVLDTVPVENEFERFERLTQALVQVSKKEIDEQVD